MAQFLPAFELAMQHEVSSAFTLATQDQFKDKGFAELNTGEVVKWGVTLTTLRALKLIPDEMQGEAADDFIRAMTPGFIVAVYLKNYWQFHQIHTVPSLGIINHQTIANKIFDMLVHRGVFGGAVIIQEALNLGGARLVVDGRIGFNTVTAINQANPMSVLAWASIRYRAQLEQIIAINPQDRQFEDGWFARAQWPFEAQPVYSKPFPPILPGVNV